MRKKRLGAGLAGAVAIASGTSAYGAVVFVAPPTDILPASFPAANTTRTWDVNGDGVTDFTFSFRQPQSTMVDWQANVFALANSAVLGYMGPFFPYAYRLMYGDVVHDGGPFIPGTASGVQVIIGSRYADTDYGQFQPPNSTGFIGFQFTAGGQTFNGYLQLKAARNFGIDFIHAAYDNTPNTPIVVIPEPGTLALLGFGAAGIAAVAARKKLKQASA